MPGYLPAEQLKKAFLKKSASNTWKAKKTDCESRGPNITEKKLPSVLSLKGKAALQLCRFDEPGLSAGFL